MQMLTNQIFMRDVTMTSDTKKAMDVEMKAIKGAVGLADFNIYLLEPGTVDWTTYSSDIMQAILAASALGTVG